MLVISLGRITSGLMEMYPLVLSVEAMGWYLQDKRVTKKGEIRYGIRVCFVDGSTLACNLEEN